MNATTQESVSALYAMSLGEPIKSPPPKPKSAFEVNFSQPRENRTTILRKTATEGVRVPRQKLRRTGPVPSHVVKPRPRQLDADQTNAAGLSDEEEDDSEDSSPEFYSDEEFDSSDEEKPTHTTPTKPQGKKQNNKKRGRRRVIPEMNLVCGGYKDLVDTFASYSARAAEPSTVLLSPVRSIPMEESTKRWIQTYYGRGSADTASLSDSERSHGDDDSDLQEVADSLGISDAQLDHIEKLRSTTVYTPRFLRMQRLSTLRRHLQYVKRGAARSNLLKGAGTLVIASESGSIVGPGDNPLKVMRGSRVISSGEGQVMPFHPLTISKPESASSDSLFASVMGTSSGRVIPLTPV